MSKTKEYLIDLINREQADDCIQFHQKKAALSAYTFKKPIGNIEVTDHYRICDGVETNVGGWKMFLQALEQEGFVVPERFWPLYPETFRDMKKKQLEHNEALKDRL